MGINSNSDGLKPQWLTFGRLLPYEAGLKTSSSANANILCLNERDRPVLLQKARMKCSLYQNNIENIFFVVNFHFCLL